MNHLFVPYEIALQLKEKGFDEFCIGLFNEEGLQYDGEIYSFPFHNSLTKEGAVDPSIVAAPLYQQVIDWFREKHNIDILLEITYGSHISKNSGDWFYFTVYNSKNKKAKRFFEGDFDKYKALRNAIEGALNLI